MNISSALPVMPAMGAATHQPRAAAVPAPAPPAGEAVPGTTTISKASAAGQQSMWQQIERQAQAGGDKALMDLVLSHIDVTA